jgi:hypothetical protein
MTYTQIAFLAVAAVITLDLVVFRTQLMRSATFWTSYAIIVPFQLLANGVFTGARIVRYDGDVIIGSTTPEAGRPPFIGDGRLAYAPIEDLMFGFALILLSMSIWVLMGRRGIQEHPRSGPPRRWWRHGPLGTG